MVGVTGSIPVAPTIPEPQKIAVCTMSPAEKLRNYRYTIVQHNPPDSAVSGYKLVMDFRLQ